MEAISLLIVDDNPVFLDIATRFLQSQLQGIIVGTALSGQEALELIPLVRPDLVLMDLAMPDLDGLEATRRIKAKPGAPQVIILTLYENDAYRTRAKFVGADDFITKWELGRQLLPALNRLFGKLPTTISPTIPQI